MLAKKCFLVGIFTLLSVSLAIAAPPAVHPTTGEPLVIDCLRGTPDAIDGDLSDWNLEAMTPAVLDTAEQLFAGQDTWDSPEDCSGEFYLLWDDVNIYIAVVVKDDKLSMNKTDGNIWNADAIEVFFSTLNAVPPHAEHYQYGINANNQRWNWCNIDGNGSIEPDYLQIASSVTADGYICEASIPYGQMPSLDFSAGNTIGLHPVLDDTDNGDREIQMTWTGREAHDQSLGFGHMVLSAEPALVDGALAELVAYWPLDNDANDAIGDLNWTLDPDGTSFSTDSMVGTGALSFDGITGEGRQDAVGPLIDAFTTKTVVLWFKADSTSGIQALYDEGGSTNGLAIRINEGTLQSAVRDASAQYTLTTPFDNTDWTEVAFSYDHGLLSLWVDGAEKATVMADFENQEVSSHSNNATIGATNQDGFGNDAAEPIDHFAGLMDDISLYDHALPIRIATLPTLADGALQSSTPVDLGWTPGVNAASHDLYLGDNLDDVDAGTEGTFLASLGQDAVGVTVDNLLAETTYYWRVEEVNDANPNSPWKGQVWSFTLAPQTASDPSPADGAMFVNPAITLSWAPGLNAESHTVYIGDNFDDVNNAADGTPQEDATYTPEEPLATGMVYYWRVDEFDGTDTHKGDVLSFETPPFIEITDPNLIGWWKLDGEFFDLGYVVDYSGYNHHGTFRGDPQLVEGYDGGALELDGSGDYVNIDGYTGINADRTDPNNPFNPAFSVTCWVKTTGAAGALVTWGSNDTTGVGGQYQSFRINAGRLRAEHGNGNLQSDTSVNDGEWHHVAQVSVEGANLRVPNTTLYIDGVEDAIRGGSDNIFNLTEDADVGIGLRASHGDRLFTGLFDDVRIYDKALTELEVKVISGLIMSVNPDPADGAKVVDAFAILGWTPGPFGVEFDVYLGTNPEPGADELVGRVSEPTHFATGLVEGETYYWRVDDVEADGATIHTGNVWSLWIPPKGAYNPVPADGEAVTDTETDLSWSADWNPVMSVVHFGTDADQVTNALAGFGPPLMETGFDPGLLELDTTYYWRADVFYGTWVTGPVWSFTVSTGGLGGP